MRVLALDTSLQQTAVAVSDGGSRAAWLAEPMERGHAERLFPMLEEVVAKAGLELAAIDRIAVTVGPGSFTGIRVALAAARALGLALDKPVIGIDTLAALAASTREAAPGPLLAAIDARRGEVYAALFDEKGKPIVPPFVAMSDAMLDLACDRAARVIGSGAPLIAHQAAVHGRRVPEIEAIPGPDPLALARIAMKCAPSAHPPVPLYIRPADAKPQAPIQGLRS